MSGDAVSEETMQRAVPIFPNTVRRSVKRDLDTVAAAMLAAIPEGDDLAMMLAGVMQAHHAFVCPENEHMAWASMTQTLLQRTQMFGNGIAWPEWFLKVAAIFRGDA